MNILGTLKTLSACNKSLHRVVSVSSTAKETDAETLPMNVIAVSTPWRVTAMVSGMW